MSAEIYKVVIEMEVAGHFDIDAILEGVGETCQAIETPYYIVGHNIREIFDHKEWEQARVDLELPEEEPPTRREQELEWGDIQDHQWRDEGRYK